MNFLFKVLLILPLLLEARCYPLNNPSDVYFFLYNQQFDNGTLLNDKSKDLYDPEKCTKIIIHGFNVNASSPWIIDMAKLFAQKDNCDSITIDWGKLSETLYIKAALNTKLVAQIVADGMVALLSQKNYKQNITTNVKNIHFIGHSVGAHLAGLAGHNIAAKLGTKVIRVSGLDPAGPYFDALFASKTRHIQKTDADFVDIIHTDAFYGFYANLGHVDFYPNGGIIQPQCVTGDRNLCSHSKAHEYYYKSIEDPYYFIGTQCHEWDLYLMNSCKNSPKAPMGIATPPYTRKQYYLRTKYV